MVNRRTGIILFLSGQRVGRTSKIELFSQDNLFPVSWIDDLTFNNPNQTEHI